MLFRADHGKWQFLEGGIHMDQFNFILPQGSTFEPETDSPQPDTDAIEALGLVEGATPVDMLETLLELNHGPIDYKEIFAIEFKNIGRRYHHPGRLAGKSKLAS
jgi:hypothetical protein